MLTGLWPSNSDDREYALSFDRERDRRLLIIPALFDEGNKLRRFTVETMRRLDAAGIDTFLPDLPGTNESLARHGAQDLATWRSAVDQAARHFRANQVLAIRGGALVAPTHVRGAHYAATTGMKTLRALLRAHVMQRREAGVHVTIDNALTTGRAEGLSMVGYDCSARLIRDLEAARPPEPELLVEQSQLQGPGLWLRTEPSEDAQQSLLLARIISGWRS